MNSEQNVQASVATEADQGTELATKTANKVNQVKINYMAVIKLKEDRQLSGAYFRFKNPNTGKFENRCFEDLPEDEQDKQLNTRGEEWLKNMVKLLSKTLNNIGEQFMIKRRGEDDDDNDE